MGTERKMFSPSWPKHYERFFCPQCGGSTFSSIAGPNGESLRQCSGVEWRTGGNLVVCTYSWESSVDDRHFYISREKHNELLAGERHGTQEEAD